MRWVHNKYVDDTGRIVAATVPSYGAFLAWEYFTSSRSSAIGRFITEPDAKRAIESWWNKSKPSSQSDQRSAAAAQDGPRSSAADECAGRPGR